ncbi:N-acetylgalactosamine 6-sulfate sulfatase [Planctomycetales bacterium 10988]|nr:N-acetylgalactosamine 6-sulfate sulfatase [Planctomycetales bacterium 10988]
MIISVNNTKSGFYFLLFGLLVNSAFGIRALFAETILPAKPNILVIVADDLGYNDVGFNGLTQYKTPHLDKLASDGTICRSGYASHAFCGPTRAGLMTGRYQGRFGFEGNPKRGSTTEGLPPEEETIADILSTAGYHTTALGKWHLGEGKMHHPLERGFQSFFGFLEGSRSYYKTNDLKWLEQNAEGERTERKASPKSRSDYITDYLTDEAIEFIEANHEEPFFMYLAYNAPHGPLQATGKWMAKVSKIENKRRQTYAAMVVAMDDGIGKVRQALKDQGIERETLIFFFSDNGGIPPANEADNTPLSGMKGTLMEGGIRVPYVVTWPGVIPAGQEYPHPVMSFDAFATSVAVADAKPTRKDIQLDSVDLIPYLTGKIDQPPHEMLYWRTGLGFQLAIRQGKFKYFHVHGVSDRLFNLNRDVSESKSLSTRQEDRFNQLKQKAETWSKELPPQHFTGHGLKLEEQWRSVGLEEAPDTELNP